VSEDISKEEWTQMKSAYQDHHKRLRDIEEYLHFPPDYGPADHVHEHVSNKLKEQRKAENQGQIIKSLTLATMLFILGLIGLGVKVWILQ